MAERISIVIPGDDPPQLQGSPHLERLKCRGEFILDTDRPAAAEDKGRRVANAVHLVNAVAAAAARRRRPRRTAGRTCPSAPAPA